MLLLFADACNYGPVLSDAKHSINVLISFTAAKRRIKQIIQSSRENDFNLNDTFESLYKNVIF